MEPFNSAFRLAKIAVIINVGKSGASSIQTGSQGTGGAGFLDDRQRL